MTRPQPLVLAVALVCAAAFRLVWSQDIEYKGDERYTFEQVEHSPTTGTFPRLGMVSSVGVANPGASVWVFLVLCRIAPCETPPSLARAVQVTNIAAIGGLAIMTLRLIRPEEQTAWLWAVAFASVNPTAVLVQRKIWAQSLLPIFSVLYLASWLRRDRSSGAFGWGFWGGFIGQVHMSGFAFAAALFCWTLLFGRRLNRERRTRWTPWALGTSLAAVALIPWMSALPSAWPEVSSSYSTHSAHASVTSWFWPLWIIESVGAGLRHNLGGQDFIEFLKSPVIDGHATFLIALVHVLVVALTIAGVICNARNGPVSWKNLLAGDGSETSLLLTAAFWGYGAVLTLSGLDLYPHYLIVTFPLMWVWLALAVGRERNAGLLALWVCQLVISIGILSYIHVHHGAGGDYGVVYGSQR